MTTGPKGALALGLSILAVLALMPASAMAAGNGDYYGRTTEESDGSDTVPTGVQITVRHRNRIGLFLGGEASYIVVRSHCTDGSYHFVKSVIRKGTRIASDGSFRSKVVTRGSDIRETDRVSGRFDEDGIVRGTASVRYAIRENGRVILRCKSSKKPLRFAGKRCARGSDSRKCAASMPKP